MAWGDALKAVNAKLADVRLVLNELVEETTRLPVNATFFKRREVVLASMVVTVSGCFESFLRAFAEEFAITLSGKGVPFAKLPAEIQKAHFAVGGRVLTEAGKLKRRSHLKASQSDIVKRLASVNSDPYELLWEAFAETQSNPNADAVKAYLSAMAVKKGFEQIERLLAARFPARAPSSTFLETSLDALIERRNECAHTGASGTLLDEATVEMYCDLVERIALGITEAVDEVVKAA